jgi:hypothetical protein
MEYVPKVVFIDKPFKVDALPLKDIYVLDNWLCSELQQHYDEQLRFTNFWAKANEVRNHNSTTGLPHHSFWGGSMFRYQNYEVDDDVNPLDTKFTKYLNRRLQTEFGFKWVRFQYAGLNSQTQGLHGTTHADCAEEDEWNLSFLYYPNTFWNPKWGGALRIYDSPQQGLDGRDDHIKNHQITEIEFKPNRLIMFDGRIPHGADAPNPSARYMDRRSLVVRGDEVRLTDTEENYDANDRLSYL